MKTVLASGLALLVVSIPIVRAQEDSKPAPPGAFGTADGSSQAHFTFLEQGFVVRELPVHLPAINNVAYASDGRLFAAGYDGRIWLLRDTDGDGLEDQATLFWEGKGDYETPLGMVVRDDSVYVTLRRRIERLRDTKGTGMADSNEVVASGWHETITESDNTFQHRRIDDAIGLAMDKEGRFYTSLGTPNHANGWQVDGDGKTHYRKEHYRGSVIRLGVGGKPEQLATGLRFAVALHFNRFGDLFGTDQEGYTWGPGNPFDELLHIVPKRHYGFPPQHPTWLPEVEDEPSIVDFGPMHQSACGFCFDETREGWKRFGPETWEDNAIVTGQSRGKLWRVPLVKTREGYLGRPILIGSVNMLPVDTCISPRGDLVVSCHGGKPDWGNGPKAEGRLFKVVYQDTSAPSIAAVWPETTTKVHVALSHALPPDVSLKAEITGGRYVRAGDDIETFRPGYAVIGNEQLKAPKHSVKVIDVSISSDRRNLTLTTAPHPWRCSYALKISYPEKTISADYSFGGVLVKWTPAAANTSGWVGWLPHPNLDVARRWTQGSVMHEVFFANIKTAGHLEMDGALEAYPLSHWQEIEAVERVKNKGSGSLTTPDGSQFLELLANGRGRWRIGKEDVDFSTDVPSRLSRLPGNEPIPFHIEIETGAALSLTLSSTQSTKGTPHPLSALLPIVPSAPTLKAPGPPLNEGVKEAFVPGDLARGKELFNALCLTCHTFRGQGALVGPDLTNSTERDPKGLWVDIVNPNASLNPDHIGYELTLKDGRVIVGVIASDRPGRFLLHQPGGVTVAVEHSEIETQRQLPKSLMPEGFKALGDDKLKDIITYIITPVGN